MATARDPGFPGGVTDMRSPKGFRAARTAGLGLALAVGIGIASPALAQITPEQPPDAAPPTPSANVPPPPAPEDAAPVNPADIPTAVDPATREAQLEERIRQLETMVNTLSGQVQSIQGAPDGAVEGPNIGGGADGAAASVDLGGPGGALGGPAGRSDIGATAGGPNSGVSARTNQSASGGALAPGQGTPPNPAPSDRFRMPAKNLNKAITGKFGPGFEFKTEDEEYVLQFHNLTQIDFRGYEQGGQTPVHDTFAIPRQWFMFSGRLGKPYEYFVSIQDAFDTILPLDIFFNVHYDDRVQFKVGRYKTPFTYEFYSLPIQGLINPERSLFFNNFALNREVGATVWGRLFDKTTDYAVGVFNQTQNGNLDTSDGKAVLSYLNFKPFINNQGSWLENLNFGGSVDTGNQYSTPGGPVPTSLRTAIATTGNSIIGVPFLTYNSNVRQAGWHAFWDLHAAYYYKQLSLIGEWQSGFQDYALSTSLNNKTHLPIDSFYLQGGYFLTGETVSQRGVVKPLHDFDLRPGKRGIGAWEATTRYNVLSINNQVFTSGLADPNLNANRVQTVDVGLNWTWNQYVKMYFTWQHAMFNNPVVFAPGREQVTSDLFLVRWQLFF